MREALSHRGYMLLTVGFFVCGFQVVFVGVHLPVLPRGQGNASACRGDGARADRPLQHRRHATRPAGSARGCRGSTSCRRSISARAVVIALFIALPAQRGIGLRVCGCARLAVAFDGAADQQPRRHHLRRPLPCDALGLHVLQPPDRQLPGRVARRPPLRHTRAATTSSGGSPSRSASPRGSSTCRSTSARSSAPLAAAA